MLTTERVTNNRIAEILSERKMTPYRLAKLMGRRTHVVTRILDGSRNASDKLKAEIAASLGLPVEEVFFIGEYRPKNTSENSSQIGFCL